MITHNDLMKVEDLVTEAKALMSALQIISGELGGITIHRPYDRAIREGIIAVIQALEGRIDAVNVATQGLFPLLDTKGVTA